MSRINRGAMALAVASALTAGVLVGPSVASAKTVKFKTTTKSKTTGITLTGTVAGTFGKGKLKGTTTPPKVTLNFKFKGGTLTLKIKDGHLDANANAVGTCTISGTGKFKKAKGKCKIKTNLATSEGTQTGTVKY